jgi:hypothetical protein
MPHPKNHVKLTGDTHPPEVEFDLDTRLGDDDLDVDLGGASSMLRTDDGMGAGAAAMRQPVQQRMQQQMQLGASADRYFDAAREQVRAKPYATLGAAFALGFVLARLFR